MEIDLYNGSLRNIFIMAFYYGLLKGGGLGEFLYSEN